MNPTVTIVYRFLPQYRVGFFTELRRQLAGRQIEFRLVYGKSSRSDRADERDLHWATSVKNTVISVAGHDVLWQALPPWVEKSSLVILMQETKLIRNFPLLVRRRLRGQAVAFWGHGINLQENDSSLPNRIKKKYSTAVDWWFAYTRGTAEMVRRMGFPRERITAVQNAIDTRRLVEAGLQYDDKAVLRKRLNLGDGPVALFCGGMYAEKRLGFMIDACRLLRAQFQDFEVVFLGAGPHSYLVESFVAQCPWAHYFGPKWDDERVPYFKAADVFMMPGLVGLAILDCFALELPLVTTAYPHHSPEIEYLDNGRNGVIAPDSLAAYVSAVARVISSAQLQSRLRSGCRESAKTYTLEAMVENFACGVESALEA